MILTRYCILLIRHFWRWPKSISWCHNYLLPLVATAPSLMVSEVSKLKAIQLRTSWRREGRKKWDWGNIKGASVRCHLQQSTCLERTEVCREMFMRSQQAKQQKKMQQSTPQKGQQESDLIRYTPKFTVNTLSPMN